MYAKGTGPHQRNPPETIIIEGRREGGGRTKFIRGCHNFTSAMIPSPYVLMCCGPALTGPLFQLVGVHRALVIKSFDHNLCPSRISVVPFMTGQIILSAGALTDFPFPN